MKKSRVLLAILVMAIVAVVSAGPSMAHTELVSTTPVSGAMLTQAPVAVVLTFNEDLLPDTVSVSISDASGTVLAADPAQLSGAVVTAPWPATANGGSYLIAYRVVSDDGHPVTGSIDFSIGPSADAPAASSAAAPAAESNATSPATSPAASPPWALIALVIALAAVVSIVLAISAHRRRRISRE